MGKFMRIIEVGDWNINADESGFNVVIKKEAHGLSDGLIVAFYDDKGNIVSPGINTLKDEVTISTNSKPSKVYTVVIIG